VKSVTGTREGFAKGTQPFHEQFAGKHLIHGQIEPRRQSSSQCFSALLQRFDIAEDISCFTKQRHSGGRQNWCSAGALEQFEPQRRFHRLD